MDQNRNWAYGIFSSIYMASSKTLAVLFSFDFMLWKSNAMLLVLCYNEFVTNM